MMKLNHDVRLEMRMNPFAMKEIWHDVWSIGDLFLYRIGWMMGHEGVITKRHHRRRNT